ncbi:VOC family protein [uncultured Erythrobacter sp.]|uniref:VOC family protein n=1 Tax=uncultured Erythrobacter sp. TaxID=263913 RepID=UPI00260965A2|nr:VOC family protein [uncultured Erythrobacter sp.]
MKRFHLNLRVADLDQSTTFYTHLFGTQPTVDEPDYKKWMLDDPFINFSIEPEIEGKKGVAHLGLQAANDGELAAIRQNIAAAGAPTFNEGETECCYAHSFKSWTRDPDGIVWEAFYTDGQRRDYGEMPDAEAVIAQR